MLKFLHRIKQRLLKPKTILPEEDSSSVKVIINDKEFYAPKEVLDLLLLVSQERDYYEELLFSSQRIIKPKPKNNDLLN